MTELKCPRCGVPHKAGGIARVVTGYRIEGYDRLGNIDSGPIFKNLYQCDVCDKVWVE